MAAFSWRARYASAEEHLDFLRLIIDKQGRAESDIRDLLEDVVRAALEIDWNGDPVSSAVPYVLKRFGSREYGNAVLTSDVDIVCELPNDLESYRLSMKVFLEHVLAHLRRIPWCTAINDAIEVPGKQSIGFRYAGMACDITVCCGHALDCHRPSQFTKSVNDCLNQVPHIRDLTCLVVDHAQRTSVCWSGTGSIGGHLKAVHWVLLVVAYVQDYIRSHQQMPSISEHVDYFFQHLLLFYAKFDFARQSICPGLDQQAFNGKWCPFKFRNKWQRADLENDVIWLCDPCDQSHNLARRVNGNALRNIKASLKAAGTDCKRIPGYFWTEASAHWENVGYTLNRYEPPLHEHKTLELRKRLREAGEDIPHGSVSYDRTLLVSRLKKARRAHESYY